MVDTKELLEDLLSRLLNHKNKRTLLAHPSDTKYSSALLLQDIIKEFEYELNKLEPDENDEELDIDDFIFHNR